jgi:general secretion pathway protein J
MRAARRPRGMTLLEIMVSIAILAMVSILIYGAFDSMARGKKGEAMRAERAREGREAVLRIVRDLTSAFLTMHVNPNPALQTRLAAFQAQSGGTFDRVDFAAFAHKRVDRDSHESDQCEVGYFVTRDPENVDKMDLVRREQQPMDMYPQRGGVVNVVAEDVEEFDLRYLDPMTGTWVDTWDTTQVSGQPGRLPLEIRVKLVLKGVPGGVSTTYTTKIVMPMQQPLSFAIPR